MTWLCTTVVWPHFTKAQGGTSCTALSTAWRRRQQLQPVLPYIYLTNLANPFDSDGGRTGCKARHNSFLPNTVTLQFPTFCQTPSLSFNRDTSLLQQDIMSPHFLHSTNSFRPVPISKLCASKEISCLTNPKHTHTYIQHNQRMVLLLYPNLQYNHH